ncbi:MAG: 16S rRNA (adenine(1518)-N(6)/adenine(1519)-N(6))-dimethyltransferase RsmA [Alphaproteobacteria bacterium]|nr:16S rRNA (adenine(1518)-N(6)/adenine(1519)-N(6))-dimethyltransferase RsmA [Alphaproteobacteria bacterium]
MDKINSLPPVSEMMRDCGLEPKKQFGQNFLFDLNLTGRIARSVPDIKNSIVVEVGPGPGGLTRALLMVGAKKVIAIEKDKTTQNILSQIIDAASGRLDVIYGDALKISLAEFDKAGYAICSNLPYNVGTELLINWLHDIVNGTNIKSLTLMFQREVAQRIVAKTGDTQYGRLSVLANLICDTKILFDVPNTAFVPRPKVQSAVVQLIPNKNKIKQITDIKKLENLTARLFGQRRKMIRAIIKTDWTKYGLLGTERAEELSPEIFLKILRNFDSNYAII